MSVSRPAFDGQRFHFCLHPTVVVMVNQVLLVDQIVAFDQVVVNQVVINPFVATDPSIVDLDVIDLVVDVNAVLSTWWPS